MSLTLPTSMEIRFCDLCHESIPDADFETGRAVAIDGRTMCVACGLKRSLSLSGPRAWLTLLLALYAAGVTTWLLARGTERAGGVTKPVEAAIRDQGKATFEQAVQTVEDATTRLRTHIERTRGETRKHLDTLDERLEDLSKRSGQERAEALTLTGELKGRLEAAERQVREVHEWLRELKARAERELTQPTSSEPTTAPPTEPKPEPVPAPAAPPEPVPAAPPPAVDPGELQHAIDLLQDPNAGIAFSATISLGRMKDLRAVPALIKALKSHKDFYVRLGAADALRELKACDAVLDLVDALDDKDDLVRSSANMALQGITQHEESFAPTLGKQELRKVQAAWTRWWKENELSVRQRLGQAKPA